MADLPARVVQEVRDGGSGRNQFVQGLEKSLWKLSSRSGQQVVELLQGSRPDNRRGDNGTLTHPRNRGDRWGKPMLLR